MPVWNCDTQSNNTEKKCELLQYEVPGYGNKTTCFEFHCIPPGAYETSQIETTSKFDGETYLQQIYNKFIIIRKLPIYITFPNPGSYYRGSNWKRNRTVQLNCSSQVMIKAQTKVS